MALKFKKGAKVRQVVQAPVEGTVTDIKVDIEGGEVQYLVERTCEHGHRHGVYMTEDQLEAIPGAEPDLAPEPAAPAKAKRKAK